MNVSNGAGNKKWMTADFQSTQGYDVLQTTGFGISILIVDLINDIIHPGVVSPCL